MFIPFISDIHGRLINRRKNFTKEKDLKIKESEEEEEEEERKIQLIYFPLAFYAHYFIPDIVYSSFGMLYATESCWRKNYSTKRKTY